MTRIRNWAGVLAGIVFVVAVWMTGRIELASPAGVPGQVVSERPNTAPVETVGSGSELIIFQAAVDAREQVRRDLARPRAGSRFVFAPNSSQRGEAKRELQIANATAKALSTIAAAYGLSYDELLALVTRGDLEGWPVPE